MVSVLRAAAVYGALLVFFRLSGKRTLAQVTTFDLILTLIISESIQQALVGENGSFTNALLIILTLVSVEVGLSWLSARSEKIDKAVNGVPLLLVDNGEVLHERMKKVRVTEDDILSSARRLQGLERIDQIKYAVMETDGSISVIPHN